eukprot:337513-Rhodomonas_salina.1
MNFEFDVAVTQKQYEKNIGNAITDIRRKTDFEKQYEEYKTQVKNWNDHLKMIDDNSDAIIFSKEFSKRTMAYVKEIGAMKTTLERTFNKIKGYSETMRAQPKLTKFIDELLEMEKTIKEKQNIEHLLDVFKNEYKDEFEYVFPSVSSTSVIHGDIQNLKSDFETKKATLNNECNEALEVFDTVKQKTLKNKDETLFDTELSALRAWMTKIEVNRDVTDKALDELKSAAKNFVAERNRPKPSKTNALWTFFNDAKQNMKDTLKDIQEIQRNVGSGIQDDEKQYIKELETIIEEVSNWLNDEKNSKEEKDLTGIDMIYANDLKQKTKVVISKSPATVNVLMKLVKDAQWVAIQEA